MAWVVLEMLGWSGHYENSMHNLTAGSFLFFTLDIPCMDLAEACHDSHTKCLSIFPSASQLTVRAGVGIMKGPLRSQASYKPLRIRTHTGRR
jgi:hypothetical protein